jgi:hypothetical protein
MTLPDTSRTGVVCHETGLPAVFCQGTISEAAEKVGVRVFVSGHGFKACSDRSRRVPISPFYFCHPERALAREGSAVLCFSAASSVIKPLFDKHRGR